MTHAIQTESKWHQRWHSWDHCLESTLFSLNALGIDKGKQQLSTLSSVLKTNQSATESLMGLNIIDIEDTYIDNLVSHPAFL